MANFTDQQINQKIQAFSSSLPNYYAGVVERGPVQQLHTNYTPPKPGFFSQVGHSVLNLGKEAALLPVHIAESAVHPLFGFAKNLGQALPFGPLSLHQQNLAHQNALAALTRRSQQDYSAFKSGRITAQEYKQRLAQNTKDESALSAQIQQQRQNIPTTGQIIKNAAGTAALPFAFGRLEAAGEGAGALMQAIESAASKIPSIGKALERAPQAESAVATALKAIPRYEFGAPSLINALPQPVEQLAQHEYKNAALNTALLSTTTSDKGAVGLLGSNLKKLGGVVDKAIFNKPGSVINQLAFKGGETVPQFLQGLSGRALQKYTNIAKVAEQHFQDENRTARKLVAYQESHHNPINQMGAKEFLDMQAALAKSSNRAQKVVTNLAQAAENGDQGAKDKLLQVFGHVPSQEEISRVGVGKFGQSEAADLVKRLSAAGTDTVERGNIINRDIKSGLDYTKNPNVLAAVQHAAAQGDVTAMKTEINAITRTRNASRILGAKTQNGYFPIIKPKGSASFVAPNNAAELSAGKQAPLGAIGNLIERAGLSPRATESGEIPTVLQANFNKALQGTDYEGQQAYIWRQINNLVRNSKTAFSAQQLTPSAIKNALGPTYGMSDARKIKGAILQAYGKLPANLTGLGGKIVNKVIQHVPAEAYYLRAQMPAKYEYNPFFYVKQLTKSSLVGLSESGGRWSPMSRDTERTLESVGLFNKGLRDAGEADFFGSAGAELDNRQISRLQKNIVGGMAEAMAKAQDKKLSEVWQENGPLKKQIEDAVRVSLGYPKGGYLNSPLAKSLNILVFPSRFDTKIAMEAGKFMAKLAPVTQVELIRHLADARAWANSPQGQKWQRDNANLLSILKTFTPISTLANVGSFLHSGKLADLGELGGLPIGVLTTILQNQGTKLPGVAQQSEQTNPATGQPYVNKIPTTTKAHIQQAFTDLISSLFSYPGKTVGLSSKTDVIQSAVPALKPSTGSFKYELPNGQLAPPLSKGGTISTQPPSQKVALKQIALPKLPPLPSRSSQVVSKPKKTKYKTVPKSLQLR